MRNSHDFKREEAQHEKRCLNESDIEANFNAIRKCMIDAPGYNKKRSHSVQRNRNMSQRKT